MGYTHGRLTCIACQSFHYCVQDLENEGVEMPFVVVEQQKKPLPVKIRTAQ
jgi:hypothetical protein